MITTTPTTTAAYSAAHTTTVPAADLAYPVQLRLPGQAGAPEGPVDPFMMYVIHHFFRRELADFAACVPHTPVDDIATWGALAERWSLFCETLHHHHTGEDEVLWPLLLERSNPAEQVVIYAMEAEHEVIDPLMALCTAGFLRMATPDPDFGGCERIRTDLASAVERTRVVLGNHLAHEEGEAIAIVQRHMTPGEWTDFEKKMGDGSTLREALTLAPAMLAGLDDADRAAVLTRVPTALRVIAWLGGRRFWRAHRRTFFYDPR